MHWPLDTILFQRRITFWIMRPVLPRQSDSKFLIPIPSSWKAGSFFCWNRKMRQGHSLTSAKSDAPLPPGIFHGHTFLQNQFCIWNPFHGFALDEASIQFADTDHLNILRPSNDNRWWELFSGFFYEVPSVFQKYSSEHFLVLYVLISGRTYGRTTGKITFFFIWKTEGRIFFFQEQEI